MADRPAPQRVRDGQREWWSTGWHAIRWIEAWCTFTNGRWLGQPFRLLPWQKRLLHELFEVDRDGRRVYRMALIGIPRKAGKTELAAALAAYLAWADGEPAAEVYCAAATQAQADRTFMALRRMCELGPLGEFAVLPGQRVDQPRIYLRDDPYSFVQRLSSSGTGQHGLNVHGLILDELHAWTRGSAEELWAALTTASGAREQPLHIAITTAGWDMESRCGQLYRMGREIEAGARPARGFFFRWWQAPPHLDYRSPEAWRLASPSFGHIVDEGFYESMLNQTTESQFRRLYLNQWTSAEEAWVRTEEWDACELPGAALIPGLPTYVGWDASNERDATAVVAGQWQEAAGGRRFVVAARTWQRPLLPDGSPVPGWRVPQEEVIAHVEALCDEFDVRGIAYDPAFIAWVTAELEARGLPMVKWPQTTSRMAPATQAAYELITAGILAHPGDPVLTAHVTGSAAKQLPAGGIRIVKGHEASKIDAAVAMVMAIGLMRDLERSGAAEEEVAIYIPGREDVR